MGVDRQQSVPASAEFRTDTRRTRHLTFEEEARLFEKLEGEGWLPRVVTAKRREVENLVKPIGRSDESVTNEKGRAATMKQPLPSQKTRSIFSIR